MATKDDTEEYDRRLQALMQDCLPNILVEIADRRPQDPIAFMARALYRYRNRDPPATAGSSNNTLPAGPKSIESLAVTMPIAPTDKQGQETLLPRNQRYTIIQGSDSFHEKDVYSAEIQNIKVHDSLLGLFSYIGDLFDDEDI